MKKLLTLSLSLLLGLNINLVAHAEEDELLEPEKAFAISTRMKDDNTVIASWKVAEGYYLYRRTEGESEFQRLTGEFLALPSYFDQSVEDGQLYTYTVTAIDNATQENQSAPSPEVSIEYRY